MSSSSSITQNTEFCVEETVSIGQEDDFEGDCLETQVSERLSCSSLTFVANRSLDLSQNLTDICFQRSNLHDSNQNVTTQEVHLKTGENTVNEDIAENSGPNTHRLIEEFSDSFFISCPPPPEEDTISTHESNESTSLQMHLDQRFLVMREIVETERNYCSSLRLLQNHFAEKMAASGFLEPSDISIIFPPCLQHIRNRHNIFFERLESRLTTWSESSTVADLFNALVESTDYDLLKQYQEYVSLFRDSALRFRQLCRLNPELEKFVKELEMADCCERLGVSAYLLTPIQRIPRYVLLLKQLSKHTSQNHPDSLAIERCLAKLGEFLATLNDSIESSVRLVAADKELLRPKRRFNLSSLSFRPPRCDSNTDERAHARLPKCSNSLKRNRISLDLSFLGAFKQKKPVNKKISSDISCTRESEPVEASKPQSGVHLAAPSSNLRKLQQSKLGELSIKSSAKICDDESNVTKTTTKRKRNSDVFEDETSPVCDNFPPTKRMKLENVTEKLNTSRAKKKGARRKTSVRAVIRSLFIRKDFSKKPNIFQRSSKSNDVKRDCGENT